MRAAPKRENKPADSRRKQGVEIMIYVVEIPNQRPASAWSAPDEENVTTVCSVALRYTNYTWEQDGGNVRYWDGAELVIVSAETAPSEFQYWTDALASDGRGVHIYVDAADAVDDVVYGAWVHRGVRARACLMDELVRNNEAPFVWVIEGDAEDFADPAVLTRYFDSAEQADAAARASAKEPESEYWTAVKKFWPGGPEA
jgi:hypothetical protein